MVQTLGAHVRKDKMLARFVRGLSVDSISTVNLSNSVSSVCDSCGTGLKNAGIEGVDSKLLKELTEDNIDEAIIGEEIEKLSEEYDLRATTWRHRMVHFLHTVPMEAFMITLVIIDVLIILGILVLDMYIMQGEIMILKSKGKEVLQFIGEECTALAPLLNKTDYVLVESYKAIVKQSAHGSADASDEHHRRKRAASPLRHAYGEQKTFDLAHERYTTITANHILHYCSIAILSVFVVEVGLKIIGYGKNYFKNKWEVIDGVVIIISFSMDIAITDQEFSHEVGKTVLVIFLMWRVIRILNAMVLTSRARSMFRLRVLRKSKRIAEDKNKALSQEKQDLMEEVKKLREIATAYGAPNHEVQAIRALSKTNVSQTKAGLKNMMAQILNMNAKIASSNTYRRSFSCNERQRHNSAGSSSDVSSTSLSRIQSRRPSMIGDDTVCHDRAEAMKNRSISLDIEPGPMRERAASDAGMTRLRHKKLFSGLRGRKDSLAASPKEKCKSQSNEKLSPNDTKSPETHKITIQDHDTIHEHHHDECNQESSHPGTTDNNNDKLQPTTPSNDTGIQPSLSRDLNSEPASLSDIKITANRQPNGHVVVDCELDNHAHVRDDEGLKTVADPSLQPIDEDNAKTPHSTVSQPEAKQNGHVSIQIPEINIIDSDGNL